MYKRQGFVIPGVALLGDASWFHLAQYTSQEGFWIFSKTVEVVDVVTAKGLPLLFATEFLAFAGSIVGFYFGQSAAKMANPYK